MACGGCARRKEKMKQIWRKHNQPAPKPAAPPSEPLRASGGLSRKMTVSGSMRGVKIHVVQGK